MSLLNRPHLYNRDDIALNNSTFLDLIESFPI